MQSSVGRYGGMVGGSYGGIEQLYIQNGIEGDTYQCYGSWWKCICTRYRILLPHLLYEIWFTSHMIMAYNGDFVKRFICKECWKMITGKLLICKNEPSYC